MEDLGKYPSTTLQYRDFKQFLEATIRLDFKQFLEANKARPACRTSTQIREANSEASVLALFFFLGLPEAADLAFLRFLASRSASLVFAALIRRWSSAQSTCSESPSLYTTCHRILTMRESHVHVNIAEKMIYKHCSTNIGIHLS